MFFARLQEEAGSHLVHQTAEKFDLASGYLLLHRDDGFAQFVEHVGRDNHRLFLDILGLDHYLLLDLLLDRVGYLWQSL